MNRWIQGLSAAAIPLLLLLVGCGVPVDVTPGYGSGAFPHPAGYSRLHMEDAEEGDSACFECHGEDEDTQVEGSSALHCSLCHAYPPVHLEDDE